LLAWRVLSTRGGGCCSSGGCGFPPKRPSAARREGCTYATFQCSGPSTRRNVSGCIVPAPISMSRGCCNRQPRVAQNSESLKISCCRVTRSRNYNWWTEGTGETEKTGETEHHHNGGTGDRRTTWWVSSSYFSWRRTLA